MASRRGSVSRSAPTCAKSGCGAPHSCPSLRRAAGRARLDARVGQFDAGLAAFQRRRLAGRDAPFGQAQGVLRDLHGALRDAHGLLRHRHVEEGGDDGGAQVGARARQVALGNVARQAGGLDARGALAAQFHRHAQGRGGGARGAAVVVDADLDAGIRDDAGLCELAFAGRGFVAGGSQQRAAFIGGRQRLFQRQHLARRRGARGRRGTGGAGLGPGRREAQGRRQGERYRG